MRATKRDVMLRVGQVIAVVIVAIVVGVFVASAMAHGTTP
jgi:hypothetical protein